MDPIDTQHEGNGTRAQDHTAAHRPIAAQTIEELTNQVVEEFRENSTLHNLGERAAVILPRLRRLLSLRRQQYDVDADMEEEEDVASPSLETEPAVAFDTSLATRHIYLGEVDDLETCGTILDPGHSCCLPLLSLPAVVLAPGATLPLRLITRQNHHVVRMALTAAAPYSCLLVVACWNLLTQGHGLLACTAELRQMRELDDGTINCLAVGRQRCRVGKLKGGSKAEVLILQDDSLLRVPREARADAASWGSWAYRAFDPGVLADTARSGFAEVAPNVQQPRGDPEKLSYWLAANMPLHYTVKTQLLGMDNTSYRLRKLIDLLHSMKHLRCRKCMREVAHARDMLAMSEAGSGSVFVNAHGYTHELVTIKEVGNVVLEGFPKTMHSWFPGYAWTIARCSNCFLQLGWQFTAVRRGLQPASFWGLRSQAVEHGESDIHLADVVLDDVGSDSDY